MFLPPYFIFRGVSAFYRPVSVKFGEMRCVVDLINYMYYLSICLSIYIVSSVFSVVSWSNAEEINKISIGVSVLTFNVHFILRITMLTGGPDHG